MPPKKRRGSALAAARAREGRARNRLGLDAPPPELDSEPEPETVVVDLLDSENEHDKEIIEIDSENEQCHWDGTVNDNLEVGPRIVDWLDDMDLQVHANVEDPVCGRIDSCIKH